MSEEVVGIELEEPAMEAPFVIEGEGEAENGQMMTESELHDLLAQSAKTDDASVELAAGFSGAGFEPEPEPNPEPSPEPETAPAEAAYIPVTPYLSLDAKPGAAMLLDAEVAAQTLMAPLEMRGDALVVLAAMPTDPADLERVQAAAGCPVEVREGGLSQVVDLLRRTYGCGQDELARQILIQPEISKQPLHRAIYWLRGVAS